MEYMAQELAKAEQPTTSPPTLAAAGLDAPATPPPLDAPPSLDAPPLPQVDLSLEDRDDIFDAVFGTSDEQPLLS
eukprot:11567363-Alexandrium_andersonii.AAC.1